MTALRVRERLRKALREGGAHVALLPPAVPVVGLGVPHHSDDGGALAKAGYWSWHFWDYAQQATGPWWWSTGGRRSPVRTARPL